MTTQTFSFVKIHSISNSIDAKPISKVVGNKYKTRPTILRIECIEYNRIECIFSITLSTGTQNDARDGNRHDDGEFESAR